MASVGRQTFFEQNTNRFRVQTTRDYSPKLKKKKKVKKLYAKTSTEKED